MKEENNKYLLLEAEKKSIDLFEPQLNEMALDLNTRFQAIQKDMDMVQDGLIEGKEDNLESLKKVELRLAEKFDIFRSKVLEDLSKRNRAKNDLLLEKEKTIGKLKELKAKVSQNFRRLEKIQSGLLSLVASARIQSIIELQDEEDKHNLALYGTDFVDETNRCLGGHA